MKKSTPFLLLLFFLSLLACRESKIGNPKQQLLETFKSQNIDPSWNFETTENDSMEIASFKNKSIREQILLLSSSDTSLVLDFVSVKKKGSSTTTIFKSELIKHDSIFYIERSDAAGKEIDKIMFPVIHKKPTTVTAAGPDLFTSVTACLNDFMCKHRGEMQCQANQTCRPAIGDVDCCLTNGQCIDILIVINPTKLLCSILADLNPDILVLQQ